MLNITCLILIPMYTKWCSCCFFEWWVSCFSIYAYNLRDGSLYSRNVHCLYLGATSSEPSNISGMGHTMVSSKGLLKLTMLSRGFALTNTRCSTLLYLPLVMAWNTKIQQCQGICLSNWRGDGAVENSLHFWPKEIDFFSKTFGHASLLHRLRPT